MRIIENGRRGIPFDCALLRQASHGRARVCPLCKTRLGRVCRFQTCAAGEAAVEGIGGEGQTVM